MSKYRRNHYVPQWYQHRFLTGNEKEKKFYYLDKSPEKKKLPNGKHFTMNPIQMWGPAKCFCENDLYTTKFLNFESTEIEQFFFGKIDREGKKAIEYFANFQHPSANHEAFQAMMVFMSSQKLRTPKGLAYLNSLLKGASKNQVLFKLQKIHRMHCALWTECVWSLVDASESTTKFILSDHPVTVYNQGCFPASNACRGFRDPGIWLNGTHTIYPLSLDKALILTNLSWARNPYGNEKRERPHAQLFRTAMFKFTSIQTSRVLQSEEVKLINHIVKSRAYRFIASTKEEWLYPEKELKIPSWDKIGKSYLLMPDPRSMTFSSEILIGYKGGLSDAFDEYGRKPWHQDYLQKELHNYELHTLYAFKGEYARKFGPKRRGITFELGSIEKSEDDEDYHKYTLSLESEHKKYVKSSNRKKRKK